MMREQTFKMMQKEHMQRLFNFIYDIIFSPLKLQIYPLWHRKLAAYFDSIGIQSAKMWLIDWRKGLNFEFFLF